jgi:UDP-glucuronate 4-epimerase
MKILVTGGAGFIGFHTVAHLVQKGHEVLAIDNYTDYYSVELKNIRTKKLLENYGVSVANIDLASHRETRQLISKSQPEAVIHLAAQAGVRLPYEENERYISSNLTGYANVLTEAVLHEVPQFLYASSSSVYGNHSVIPYSENELNLRPVSFYGATKLANETITPALVFGKHTKARGMRFFTVYGELGRPDMAYFRLFASALEKFRFEMFGNGAIERDFTYVGDVVHSIGLLLNELTGHVAGYSDVVNVGGGNPASLNQLVDEIQNITGKKVSSSPSKANPNDVQLTNCNTDYLQKLTKYVPSTDLREGLGKFFDWAKEEEASNKLTLWAKSVT